MGLLQKFFGKKPEEKASAPTRVWLPRASRIRIEPLHGLSFRLRLPTGAGTEIPVFNLSTTGIALARIDSDPDLVRGDLSIGGQTFEVHARLMRTTWMLAGLAFESPSVELVQRIQQHFEIELAALRMTALKPDLLEADPEGTPSYCFSQNGCEFFCVTREDRIVRFHLTFLGNYLEGNGSEPVRYGWIERERDEDKLKHKGSKLVRWSTTLPPDLASLIRRFLGQVPVLNASQREEILGWIEDSLK